MWAVSFYFSSLKYCNKLVTTISGNLMVIKLFLFLSMGPDLC